MAIIINLDSTLETASVSIAKDGLILMQQSNTVQKEHAAFLHSSIKNMLVKLNISINNICDEGSLFCPMIDARRMEVYTALYNKNLEEIITPHAEIINEQFCATFLKNNKVIFLGNGIEKFKNIASSTNATFQQYLKITEAINLLSYDKFCGENFADIVTSSPLYTKEFYNL